MMKINQENMRKIVQAPRSIRLIFVGTPISFNFINFYLPLINYSVFYDNNY
jgi:hypothetical protein